MNMDKHHDSKTDDNPIDNDLRATTLKEMALNIGGEVE